MNEDKNYVVVYAITSEELEEKVNDLIYKGYELVGGMIVRTDLKSYTGDVFFQAMIKESIF